jgi:hypothetical protein
MMNPIYFSIGGLVFAVAMFKRELLIQKQSLRILLGLSIALFLAGLILHFRAPGQHPGSGALLCPLLSLGLFHLVRRLFLLLFEREPKDTWLNWQPGLGADRIF